MPLAGTQRCKACGAFKPRDPAASWRPHHGIGGGRRCKACANKPAMERRTCARCATDCCCTKRGGDWACVACGEAAILRSGRVPPKRTVPLSLVAQRGHLEMHYTMRFHVDLWVVPLSPWCPLLMLRLVLWRRFGIVAGILVGPPVCTFPWSAGVRGCDREELALHFRELFTVQPGAARPLCSTGTTPILVTGCVDADLAESRLEVPLADRARLKAYKDSLSERMSTRGWSRHSFNLDPAGTPECTLVRRARGALQAAGLPQVNNLQALSAGGARGAAFRAMYSGSRF